VAALGRWMHYDGARWMYDDTLHAFDRARAICREVALGCDKPSSVVASAKTVAAVEKLARADRRLAATIGQWDTDPWALNTPAGVIDLCTGRLRPHCAIDYMTRIAAVAPDSKCPISAWLAFLNRVAGGDAELVAFLQRMCGYALTGITREHALFFLHGVGANGKSTFINVLTGIIGDYHRAAPIETFTASHTDQHPTDLAGLRGARLVTSVETEEGRRWAESKIKALTGGDEISARFMRQDFFEFVPTLSWVAGDNDPHREPLTREAAGWLPDGTLTRIVFLTRPPPPPPARRLDNWLVASVSGRAATCQHADRSASSPLPRYSTARPHRHAAAPRSRPSRALCRARVAEKLQRRRGTRIGEHLKLVLSTIDRQQER
jgi:phage/plasmid-associated DNA primase